MYWTVSGRLLDELERSIPLWSYSSWEYNAKQLWATIIGQLYQGQDWGRWVGFTCFCPWCWLFSLLLPFAVFQQHVLKIKRPFKAGMHPAREAVAGGGKLPKMSPHPCVSRRHFESHPLSINLSLIEPHSTKKWTEWKLGYGGIPAVEMLLFTTWKKAWVGAPMAPCTWSIANHGVFF